MHKQILETNISETDYEHACDRIQALVQTKQSSYVIAANVHVVMTAYWKEKYRQIVNEAALVTPDGMPLVWGLRWLGAHHQSRVYGPDLMLAWCDRSIQNKSSIYLYGSTPQTLQRLKENLHIQFPQLIIAGSYSPPFRTLTSAEELADRERIQRSGADVVFVGLGCPKQEEWMYQQLGHLDAVMIGVGAAFQFHSGEIAQAPQWMMRFGLEWLFRLSQEPGRLWSRYLLTNISFTVLFFCQIASHAFSKITQRLVVINTSAK